MTDFLTELREELLDGLERHERAPWWRRVGARGRARLGPAARRLTAVAVAAAAAIAVALQLAERAPELEQETTPQVSRLEGFHATGLVAVDGSLWVTQYDIAALLRIDLETGKVRARIDVGGSPGGVIAAGGALWVVSGAGPIAELDARTGRILGRARGPDLPLEKSRRTAADDSGLWISSPARREVVHIDERTRRVTRFPLHGDPGPLAIVDRRIWVGTMHDTGSLTRITVLERNGHIVATTPLPDHAAVNIVPAPGGGAWVAFGEDATVSPAALRIPDP